MFILKKEIDESYNILNNKENNGIVLIYNTDKIYLLIDDHVIFNVTYHLFHNSTQQYNLYFGIDPS